MIYGLLDTPKKLTKFTILSIFFTQDSEFCSFFGRIQETINYFPDLLTFNSTISLYISDFKLNSWAKLVK